ncbi:MAG TPA: ATP-binding protein [Roseiflexaceae bacterium]|nr:ATP-binding protein [Roseiflexaceae bacterium]HMP40154.1 ATP-binding protein [Roseiflexaceae bacterium]
MTSTINGTNKAPHPAPRILVVDDEQSVCDVCTRTLTRCGYDVVATTNPNAAVGMLQRTPMFDLLLTDIKMPQMSGLELAQIARDHDPAIAIIIMTGYASVEHLHMSVQRGVADFLSKPFEIEYLRLAVDQALHKRSLLQDNLRLQTLEQLLASSEALNRSLDLAQFAEVLLRVSLIQAGCRAAFLILPETAPHITQTASSSDAVVHEAGRLLAMRSLNEQRPIVAAHEAFGEYQDQPLGYALAVPLRSQGEVSGVLLLCDTQPGLLLPGVQEGMMLLANHAGGALRNAALYSQLDEAYQRLQDLDKMKSEFISIASHELRTPLSIVLGYSSMLRDQLADEQYDYMQRILESAQRIKYLVDDMVSLRHIETGEAQLHLDLVAIPELINETLGQFRSIAAGRQHTLSFEHPSRTINCLCDREKIALVLKHLIANAIKFTPEGGRITVLVTIEESNAIKAALPQQHGSPHTGDPWLVIAVRDTGIGIAKHEQTRIFDRFYQAADSLTRDHGGIGLGLALVRELVSSHGGVVWVDSRPTEGSTFSFAVPFRHSFVAEPRSITT